MKPRIKRSLVNPAQWLCYSPGRHGYGRTPDEAFDSWVSCSLLGPFRG